MVCYHPAITRGWIETVAACIALHIDNINMSLKSFMTKMRYKGDEMIELPHQ